MLVVDNLVLSLGFHSQDNYSPRDRKEYRSFLSMIDPTAIALRFLQNNWKRADMTSRLIRSGLSDRPSNPVRAKVECCKSHDLFGCQIKDCSATRIPSLSITGRHPRPTGSFIGWGGYPSAEVQSAYSTAQLGSSQILIFMKTFMSNFLLIFHVDLFFRLKTLQK